jgi:phosphoribosylglycinamide formyltransferase-1
MGAGMTSAPIDPLSDLSAPTPDRPRKRAAILISGRGSNMMSLVEASKSPDYPVEFCLVVSDNPQAAGLTWARDQGLPVLALDPKHFSDRAHLEGQLNGVLEASGVELVCLAGFMRLLSSEFVVRWHNRLVNIHPSLLPAFRGLDTHARALEAGVKVAGCTVHLVRPKMDEGPILGQAVVPVRPDDTPDLLGARILAAEHRLYPRVVALFAIGRIVVDGDKVTSFPIVSSNWTQFVPDTT